MKTTISARYTIRVKFTGGSVALTIMNRDTGSIQQEVIPIIGETEDTSEKKAVSDDVNKDVPADNVKEDSEHGN